MIDNDMFYLNKLIEESSRIIIEANKIAEKKKIVFDITQDDLEKYEEWLLSDDFVNPYK